MVTVTASYTVAPQEPTPNGHLTLSQIDQIQPNHITAIFVYKSNPKSRTNAIKALRDSLSKILVYYYPLAGRLRRITQGGLLELQCNAKGVHLFEAEDEKLMVDYGDFAPTDAIKDLIPRVDYGTTPLEEWPLLLVQLTRFSCGGLCVGIAICHVVVDGWASFQFVKLWAKLALGAENLDKHEIPIHERTLLLSPKTNPLMAHKKFQKPCFPFVLGCSDNKEEQKKETSVALLELSKDQVEKLKKKANNDKMLVDRAYSRYEAIAAHIWKCICKARQDDYNAFQPTVVRIMTDIRNRLKPSVPLNYAGNAIHAILTPVSHYNDIISNPLSFAAQKIREGTERLTDEYIRSALDYSARQQKENGLRSESVVDFYGNPNINIGSWMSLPGYEANFGWGKPVYVGVGALFGDGWSIIMAGPKGDGSVIMAFCLQTPHLEAFRKIFYEEINAQNPNIIISSL
ncbi:spermidine hydroxycinnamoyl transferase-like [Quillaja saponaria]|uniref:Spermidine hydroxycinnamoyl transferase-like n=1 Tax=Quillaja saponaria TaxID=32244 RepID=A0AAD7Q7N7_QUISA|nr:spermidine hydroxycinnamoyl transferase-like [Quillaja saponaria]